MSNRDMKHPSIAWVLLAWLGTGGMGVGGQEPHSHNHVWRQLVAEGAIPGRPEARLPDVNMADGLTGEQQDQVLRKLLGEELPVDEFARASAVAPQMVRLTDLDSDRAEPVRRLDLFFTASGSMQVLRHSSNLEK
ncbi:MAG TPA: hypothetical protein VIY86_10545, partial [Pirellulaceae bacterium]